MKYIYKNATYPCNRDLLIQIDNAARSLAEKFAQLDLAGLQISEYNQRYLGNKLRNIRGTLQLYNFLLSLILSGSKKPLKEFTFIEYGGGSGVFSLLAKQMGIGRVIYNDIYDVSGEDVKKLSTSLDLKIDDIVVGDLGDLISHINKNNYHIDAIGSYDVIEHIYDIENYLRNLSHLSKNPFRIVFGSGANIKNPRTRRSLQKEQIRIEHQSREKVWGHKDRDTLKSYLDARKEIISSYAANISSNTVSQLAVATRGLVKQDIEKCVDEYRSTGAISYKPDHPTNTCDPYTGNWAEHLMDTN